MDSSGLMHLIATVGGTNVTTNTNDESTVSMPTNGQSDEHTDEHLTHEPIEENEHHQQQQRSLVSMPMDTELQQQSAPLLPPPPPPPPPPQPTEITQPTKTAHNIAEIHRDMMALIPIPQAWPHIRHQSGLFSYPDLPHFNVIRQATFREGRFVCPFCTVDFASKEGIRYHLYNSCTKSPYPKAFFRCLMCGSELADRSSLRTHLARHVSLSAVSLPIVQTRLPYSFKGSEDGSAISADKIDVSRKPAGAAPGTPGAKKSKKKKKNAAEVTPPQMLNPMGGMASGISPRGLDAYSIPTTMANQSMSLPTIKSDSNDSDPKVNRSHQLISHVSTSFGVQRKRGRPPKSKSDGLTPVANYTKHAQMNPTMNNALLLNEQHIKVRTARERELCLAHVSLAERSFEGGCHAFTTRCGYQQ